MCVCECVCVYWGVLSEGERQGGAVLWCADRCTASLTVGVQRWPKHVGDGATVCHNQRVGSLPLASNDIVQEPAVGAARVAILSVVGAHGARGSTLCERHLIRRQVGVPKVKLSNVVRVVASVGLEGTRRLDAVG